MNFEVEAGAAQRFRNVTEEYLRGTVTSLALVKSSHNGIE